MKSGSVCLATLFERAAATSTATGRCIAAMTHDDQPLQARSFNAAVSHVATAYIYLTVDRRHHSRGALAFTTFSTWQKVTSECALVLDALSFCSESPRARNGVLCGLLKVTDGLPIDPMDVGLRRQFPDPNTRTPFADLFRCKACFDDLKAMSGAYSLEGRSNPAA